MREKKRSGKQAHGLIRIETSKQITKPRLMVMNLGQRAEMSLPAGRRFSKRQLREKKVSTLRRKGKKAGKGDGESGQLTRRVDYTQTSKQ
jgi:hypothetical protein